MKTYLTEEGIEVSGEGLDYLRPSRGDIEMTKELWNKHTPGDPMPCKCGESEVETKLCNGAVDTDRASSWDWEEHEGCSDYEITAWRFVERKGEDVIAADPYNNIIWDEDDTAIVVLKEPGQPWWVRDDDKVRFKKTQDFDLACEWNESWDECLSFQIKRRSILTPAVPQLLDLLSVATDDEADAIRSCARRANIEVPE